MRFKKVVALGLLAAVLVGCSTQSDPEPGSTDLSVLEFSYIPFTGAAPTQYGIEQGVFAKHGIELNSKVAVSPAAVIAGLASGDLAVGFTTTNTLMAAVEEGVSVKCISPVDGLVDPESEFTGLLVNGDSEVQSVGDLVGKKVGVVALGSLDHLFAMEMVKRAGVDTGAVEYVQLPFPQHQETLAAERIDAVVTGEPFTSTILADGARALAWEEKEFTANTNAYCYAASTEFIEANPELVASFIAAQAESLDLAASNVEDALRSLTSIMDISEEEAVASETGADWSSTLNKEGFEAMQEIMISHGFLKGEIPLTDIIYEP